MDRTLLDKLDITPRSGQELRAVVDGFEQKWERKVRRAIDEVDAHR